MVEILEVMVDQMATNAAYCPLATGAGQDNCRRSSRGIMKTGSG